MKRLGLLSRRLSQRNAEWLRQIIIFFERKFSFYFIFAPSFRLDWLQRRKLACWGVCGSYIRSYIWRAKEANAQKDRDRHTKERERRKEQSKKWVPCQPVVTLTGLQSTTQLNGQLGRVIGRVADKMINTGRYPVKLESSNMPLVKEENMIRERKSKRKTRKGSADV